MNSILKKYGLTNQIKIESEEYNNLEVARVIEQQRNMYKVISEQGELQAQISGKLEYQSDSQNGFPAVGDWVMISLMDDKQAIIHNILDRKSIMKRSVSGSQKSGQVIATNIDYVFVCMSLNDNFNVRRVERYLTVAWDSGATPVIVLTKADLCQDLQEKLLELEDVSVGIDIAVCSAADNEGFDDLQKYVVQDKTVVFVGSSGVGKSTLINHLIGEEVLTTKEIRNGDDKGRHTTTHRQMLTVPNGGVVIDTPGMRELKIYTGNLSKTFDDIEKLASQCKFRNCTHTNEPGCAIKDAIELGDLDAERFASYQKLQREMSYNGLNSKQLENEKINRMFGSKKEMKNHIKKYRKMNKR
ncbi:ribosome small subunit-dependent GTPase A [Companilactobacillus hulinensis]|uniref:ribosome small subunit-dependent GTPase A n=1 Tax=Companilactobacillus hulinensis TaxID=2486007 RepID=UPI000F76ABA4|nr:ribosome small subunit-dependent GTPase A [Companilactobacillus hulinensis]